MIKIDGIIITKLTYRQVVRSSVSPMRCAFPSSMWRRRTAQDLVPFDKYAFIDNFLDPLFTVDENKAGVQEKGPTSLIELSQLTNEQRKKLIDLLDSDGYDMLSKHFVRERDSWNEYKLVANEESYAMEIVDRNGKVIKAYKADRLL